MTFTIMRALLCLLIALPFTVRAQSVSEQTPTVGFVRALKGKWEIQIGGRTEQVQPGQALPAGAELRLVQPNGSIEIVRARVVTFPASCSEGAGVQVCTRAFRLPDLPPTAPLSARLKAAISRYFSAETTFANTMVRADAFLEDHVAELQDGRVNLARILKGVPKGTYRVRFTPLGKPGSASVELERAAPWTPGLSGEFPAPSALVPGMYLLSLSELREGCWVLVAGPPAAEKMDGLLSELEAVTSDWTLKAAEKKGLRRALLEQLARELQIPYR